ncbi:hypothetical protein PVAND_011447 [Polypedilum vanderplanki]|uniref:Uncharacterized protein n=1 Tax=Polypedilum vanderplanki TaxID=319348 RepID=A0A9J6CKF5_POLVA|nr:hypothetical protein PVAND_011447 [Polypedilum vanderplanki]
MAMVISSRAKGMIGAFISLILLSTVLVTASTKGWWFGLNKNNGEHVAARIQANSDSDFNDYSNENESPVLQAPPDFKNYGGYRKGEKGEKGARGIPGDSIRGPPGPPGPKGECQIVNFNNNTNSYNNNFKQTEQKLAPVCACNYDNIIDILHNESVIQILRGPQGPPGLTGAPGQKGEMGERGADGIDGIPGLPGTPGESSSNWDSSRMYKESMMGSIRGKDSRGEKGDKGDMGMKGMKGEGGAKGEKGACITVPEIQTNNCGCPFNDTYKGIKGDKGLRGKRGKTGSQGEKGQKGDSGSSVGPKGDKGERGQPGLPGPPFSGFDDSMNYQRSGIGTIITFQNTDTMIKQSSTYPVGSICYVIDEEALLVKVSKGWQYIALGTLLPFTTPYVTTSPMSPTSYMDLQASNLLNSNSILKSPESYTFTTPPEYETWNPKMLRLIALNEPYSGNLQGLRNADLNCHRQARRSGLMGNFRAFLSTRIQNLDSLIKPEDRELPITNLRGDVLFNSFNAIFNNNAQGIFLSSNSPRIISFSGKNVMNDNTWPHKIVWHGARADSIDTNCEGWHSNFQDKVGLGSSLLGNKLLAQEMYSCQQKNIVLCIEVLSHSSSGDIANRRKREMMQSNDDTYDNEK